MTTAKTRNEPLLQIEHIGSHYGPIEALSDIDMRVNEGSLVALVGANGAGKTTLLEIVVGLLEPDEGEVTRARGVRVGYLPQDLDHTPTGTVLEETLAAHREVCAGFPRAGEGVEVFRR